ncbi:TPA: hypothetical protein VB839_000682 [Streptococcus suis]|nr:hypothetical protein [Streptococcus suis]
MEDRFKINDKIKTAMMIAIVLHHSCIFFIGNWFDKAIPVFTTNYLSDFA